MPLDQRCGVVGANVTLTVVSDKQTDGAGEALWYGTVHKTPLIVIAGNLTARRYIDDVLTPAVFCL